MNRQARFVGNDEWISFGAVTFISAAEKLAYKCLDMHDASVVEIEVRDESEPDDIKTFTVELQVIDNVLNPRQGA